MGRLIGISDIHGEYDKLCRVLDKLSPQKEDTIIFMGDYIDRGLKARQVVDKIIDMKNVCHCEYLIGSHEYALLHSDTDEYYNYLFWNYGGPQTVQSYGSYENIFKIHGEFFRSLKFYYLVDKYLFVHAGLNPKYPLDEQDEIDMVYIRRNFYEHKHNFPFKVIFGHTDFDAPQVQDDKICIDTGCGKYKDSPLTAFVSDNGNEYFVNSL